MSISVVVQWEPQRHTFVRDRDFGIIVIPESFIWPVCPADYVSAVAQYPGVTFDPTLKGQWHKHFPKPPKPLSRYQVSTMRCTDHERVVSDDVAFALQIEDRCFLGYAGVLEAYCQKAHCFDLGLDYVVVGLPEDGEMVLALKLVQHGSRPTLRGCDRDSELWDPQTTRFLCFDQVTI